MNTRKHTRNTVVGIALVATLTTGLGACAGTHAFTSAERRASDISHEVERARNRVDAFAPRLEYRDQAERRLERGSATESESRYRDQAERRLATGSPAESEWRYRDQAERRQWPAGH